MHYNVLLLGSSNSLHYLTSYLTSDNHLPVGSPGRVLPHTIVLKGPIGHNQSHSNYVKIRGCKRAWLYVHTQAQTDTKGETLNWPTSADTLTQLHIARIMHAYSNAQACVNAYSQLCTVTHMFLYRHRNADTPSHLNIFAFAPTRDTHRDTHRSSIHTHTAPFLLLHSLAFHFISFLPFLEHI